MKYLVIAIFFLTLFSCKKEEVQPDRFVVIAATDMKIYTDYCRASSVKAGGRIEVESGKVYTIEAGSCYRTVVFDPERRAVDPCTY